MDYKEWLRHFSEDKDPFIQPILKIKTAKTSTMLEPDLQLELGAPPAAALDCAASPHMDPMKDRPVLLQLLGELHLDTVGLLSRHFENVFHLLRLATKGVAKRYYYNKRCVDTTRSGF